MATWQDGLVILKTGDLARLFGVSNTAVQNWSDRFEAFLSPKVGKHRVYTEDDLLILATVARLSADGFNHSGIEQKLQAGYRVESPSAANFGIDTRMIPAAAVEQIIDATELRVELEKVKSERDKLLDIVQELREENKELRQNAELRNNELRDRIEELRYQIGKLEGRIENNSRPKE